VVISIIVLLIAMLQPSINSARKHARTVKCLSQLQQIGRASDAYSVDNNSMVARDHWFNCLDPNQPGNYRHFSFLGRYSGYLNGPSVPLSADADGSQVELHAAAQAIDVWRCPSETNPAYALTYIVNGVDFDHYSSNGTYTSGAMSSIEKLPGSPSEIMYMSEANTINYQSPTSYGIYDVFTANKFIFFGGVATPAPRMISAHDTKHINSAPILFFDQHADAIQMTPDNFPMRMLNPLDPN